MEPARRDGVDQAVAGPLQTAATRSEMDSAQRAEAMEVAYKLLETPRSHLRVKFEQTEDAVLVSYRDDVLTGVALDESGINAASAMAVALGVEVPAAGESEEVLVSTDCSTAYCRYRTWILRTRPLSTSLITW